MVCFLPGRCPPLYPICCCVAPPEPDCGCGPYFTRANRIVLDRCKTAGVNLAFTHCDPADVALQLRRRGRPDAPWLLRYPALYRDADGTFVFRFDGLIYELDPGRYEAQLLNGDTPCGCLEIEVPRACLGVTRVTPVLLHGLADPEAPSEIDDMFECLYSFTAETCRVFTPAETTIPLLPADIAKLCACVLCRPVELVIDDGVQRETVKFSGCVSGAPVVSRGASLTTPRTFPKGSTVKFVWTPANVSAACEGCP
jgi:hypothetical protein